MSNAPRFTVDLTGTQKGERELSSSSTSPFLTSSPLSSECGPSEWGPSELPCSSSPSSAATLASATLAPTLVGREIELREGNLHHLKNVLRLQVGGEVLLSDLSLHLSLRGRITSIGSEHATVRIESVFLPPQTPHLHLIMGMVKPKTADFIVEKCVELGVHQITFFRAERCQGGEQQNAYKRLDRFLRIAESAAKQSGGGALPELASSRSLTETLEKIGTGNSSQRWICSLKESGVAPKILDAPTERFLLIGPEGGLTESEETLALTHGFQRLSLGARTLRAETAVIAACALILIPVR